MTTLALDTSVAIPLIVARHPAHRSTLDWWAGRAVVLCGHAVAETYSVLTRLPADLRTSPAEAQLLIETWFGPPLLPRAATARSLPRLLARAGIAGGAVYDALVGLAAADHDAVLATRDARARPTYEAVGARVELVV